MRTQSLTRLVSRPVSCGHRHLHLQVGGHQARVPWVCACARPSWLGRAGRPPGRVLVRLTFSFGRFVFLLCLAPFGLGLPLSWSFVCPPPPPFGVSFSPLLFSARPLCVLLSLVFGPGCPGPWGCVLFVLLALRALSSCWCFPPAPPFASHGFCCRCSVPCVFFFLLLLSAPPLSLAFPGFRPRVPLAFALCFVFFPFLSCLWALRALSPVFCLPLSRWLLPGGSPPPPPHPLLCLAVVVASARCLVFFSLPLCAPVVSGFFWFPAPAAVGLGAVFCLFYGPPAARLSVRSRFVCVSRPAVGCSLVVAAHPPPFVSRGFRRFCLVLPSFFFLCCARPLSLAFSSFQPRVPWASRLCVVCFVGLPLLCSPCTSASFVLPNRLLAAPWWLLPPPPPFACRGFRRCRSVLCAVFCAVLCVPGCGVGPRCCALCRPVLCCCVLCCFVALAWCRCLLCRALWRCPLPWGPVLCSAVFCGFPLRCVLCAVCVLSWRGGARCCSPLCSVLCVSSGAVLCVPCPLRSVRCHASLSWCACAVLLVWCMLLLAPGAVVRCCVFFFLRHGSPLPKALHQSGLTMGKMSVHGEPKFSEGQPGVFTDLIRVKTLHELNHGTEKVQIQVEAISVKDAKGYIAYTKAEGRRIKNDTLGNGPVD